MMNRNAARGLRNFGVVLACTGILLTVGCGEEKPVEAAQVQKKAPPPPPPPPPAPKLKTVEELKLEYGIDNRVQLPESMAPKTEGERIAVLTFFDAFARGDANSVKTMLVSSADRYQLEDMVQTGEWENGTEEISRIDIQTGKSPNGETCAMAVFFIRDSFQPQLWSYETDGDSGQFEAKPAPPRIMERLYGTDRMQTWFDEIEKELKTAEEDFASVAFQTVLDEDEEEGSDQEVRKGGMGGSGGGMGRHKPPAGPPAKPYRPPSPGK